jgi:hypothetical protein
MNKDLGTLMVSRKTVAAAIDKAEKEFAWCWKTLAAARTGKTSALRPLFLQFQSHLIGALQVLSSEYQRIAAEKRRLIQSKERYDGNWFAKRMAGLDRYLNAVTHAIGIGRTIGDGFAWIFYHEEPRLIEEHLKHQRQVNLPPGTGGVGERAFVEKAQGMAGHFILHHGMTSFLRAGDVSFIDTSSLRVAGIGELKTNKIGDHEYRITLGYVPTSKSDRLVAAIDEQGHTNSKLTLPARLKDRLDRQMREISTAIVAGGEGPSRDNIAVHGRMFYSELEEVTKRANVKRFEYIQAGKSLLIGVWVMRGKSMSKRLLDDSKIENKALSSVAEEIQGILDCDLNDNSLIITELGYDKKGLPVFQLGAIPLFWWPLKAENLRRIVFGEVFAVTMHNPAHFWDSLRQRGYEVSIGARARLLSATQKDGRRVVRLEGLDWFLALTQHFLLGEECVLEMVETTLEQASSQNGGAPVKIEMRPTMRLGAPPGSLAN